MRINPKTRVLHVIRKQHADASFDAPYMLSIVRSWSPNLETLGAATTHDEDRLIRSLLIHLSREG